MSDEVSVLCAAVDSACDADRTDMGIKGYAYLLANYTAEQSYRIIMKGLDSRHDIST